jgi:GNAT superfamily N-acetyltransferase
MKTSQMMVEIRQMLESDLPAMEVIEAECYTADVVEGIEVLRSISLMYPPGSFVAVCEGAVLGYLLSFPSQRDKCPFTLGGGHDESSGCAKSLLDCYYMHDLAVRSSARGQRVGASLVEAAHMHAAELGLTELVLTAVNNSAGHWHKYGYIEIPSGQLSPCAQQRLDGYPSGSVLMSKQECK